jgi:predicted lipoprotein with Yx(FWY)xxD motif/plastocyanin
MKKRCYAAITGVLVIIMLVISGCAATATTPAVSAPATAPTTAPAPATSYTVKTMSQAGIGGYLVDAKGMTLYYFTKDIIGKSNATGNILTAWPIFYTTDLVVPGNLNAADFTTITREDGKMQTAYKGWPLYYYAKDQKSGDILGEAFNGVWFVIKVPFYTVMLQTKTDIGNYLVDAKGMTLYYFTKDEAGKSNATAIIIANWPVFHTTDFILPSGINASDFGNITRDDGTMQTTYKGWPLYYFIKDKVSGDTAGQGVNGVWFVIDPQTLTPAPSSSTTTTTPSGSGVTIDLVAKNIAFDKDTINVPAGTKVTVNFDNQDSGIPHNFSVYTSSSATTSIFVGKVISGPAKIVYEFTAPSTPGTYFFRCDVHPTIMTGTFVVQ